MAKMYLIVNALLIFGHTYGQYTKSQKMNKPSFNSKFYRVAMRVKGIKKSIEREFQKNDFSKSQKAAEIPDKVKRVCDITYHNSKTGRTIWELKKKNTVPKRYILFIHGGYFVHNITTYDWNLLNKIVQHTDYGIVVPDYPLAPRYNYKDVYNMAVPLYEDLLQEWASRLVAALHYHLRNM
jgi:acetyl esterase/lipase